LYNLGDTRYIFKKRKNRALFSAVDCAGNNVKKLFGAASMSPEGDINNILTVRLAHIGDTLFTTPAIRCLKELYPHASITALVGGWSKELLSNNPYIDEVITLDTPWHNRASDKRFGNVSGLAKTLLALRRKKYDLAVQFGLDYHDNLICGLSGSKYSIGYAVAGFGFVLSQTVPFSTTPCHDIEHNLHLVESLGGKCIPSAGELYPSSEDFRFVEEFLDINGLDKSSFALVHPGVGEKNRQWTREGFTGVIDGLYNGYGITSVICGGPVDIYEAMKISEAASVPTVMAAGETSLLQLASLASQARVCVCLESSFAHISAAMGAPTVAIFSGFTDTERWRVAGDSAITIKIDLPCSTDCDPQACPHRFCLTSITPDRVLMSIEYAMNRSGNETGSSEEYNNNSNSETSVSMES